MKKLFLYVVIFFLSACQAQAPTQAVSAVMVAPTVISPTETLVPPTFNLVQPLELYHLIHASPCVSTGPNPVVDPNQWGDDTHADRNQHLGPYTVSVDGMVLVISWETNNSLRLYHTDDAPDGHLNGGVMEIKIQINGQYDTIMPRGSCFIITTSEVLPKIEAYRTNGDKPGEVASHWNIKLHKEKP